MAIIILIFGPYTLSIINYGVTLIFTIITIQQLYDSEESSKAVSNECTIIKKDDEQTIGDDCNVENKETQEKSSQEETFEKANSNSESNNQNSEENCDPCNENRIFNLFQTLREKFDFGENL